MIAKAKMVNLLIVSSFLISCGGKNGSLLEFHAFDQLFIGKVDGKDWMGDTDAYFNEHGELYLNARRDYDDVEEYVIFVFDFRGKGIYTIKAGNSIYLKYTGCDGTVCRYLSEEAHSADQLNIITVTDYNGEKGLISGTCHVILQKSTGKTMNIEGRFTAVIREVHFVD